MAKEFTPSFRDLERDIERHLERFGRKGKIMGIPALFGHDESRRAVFDAYVNADKDAEIVAWLIGHWYYTQSVNPFFEEYVKRLAGQKATARLSRLWRHVWFVQLEHYTVLKSHPAAGPDKKATQ